MKYYYSLKYNQWTNSPEVFICAGNLKKIVYSDDPSFEVEKTLVHINPIGGAVANFKVKESLYLIDDDFDRMYDTYSELQHHIIKDLYE